MNPLVMMVNAARRLENLFPGYFPNTKHSHGKDFGWPDHLTFDQLYKAYLRNGIARAGIDKTVGKTWQDFPFLLEMERDGSEGGETEETSLERDIRQRFDDLRVWQHLAEADRRSLVGCYSGVIMRLADSKRFQEPVDTVPGGLAGLVELIPAWEGQLQVAEWDTDEMSETYGQPLMFQFNEAQVASKANDTTKTRSFMIHPDRVLVWSRDGTVHGTSFLEPGYNDLIDLEKIKGAGGEGFWKNAKSAPVLNLDKDAKIGDLAKGMGVSPAEVGDKIGEQVEDWQKGFDQLLMLQGMEAKALGITLPSPEHFWAAPLQSFAASISMPLKILVGSQTGERASTEDASEWSQTIMSRRNSQTVPNVMALVRRLERFSILPEGKDWFLDWPSLMDPTPTEQIERAAKMADINAKMQRLGEFVFTPDEMRQETGREPLTDAQRYRDDLEDSRDALPPPAGPAQDEE
jgi:hypothetical protein